MKLNFKKNRPLFLAQLFFLGGAFFLPQESFGDNQKKRGLPVIIEVMPQRLYQILGPVGAQKKEMGDARNQLRKEAKKLDADALLHVRCEKGGVVRHGLTWHKKSSYCRGIAIRFADDGEDAPQKKTKTQEGL